MKPVLDYDGIHSYCTPLEAGEKTISIKLMNEITVGE
jgi:hypothetical protein